jgi:uncharacterized metal-binding protein YceD (DUF177 family)
LLWSEAFRREGLDCCVGLFKKVDVGPVLTAGQPLALDIEVDIPEFGAYRFPEPAHVVFDVVPFGRGIRVDGTIEAAWMGACDRCLEDVHGALQVDVDEQFDATEAASPLADNNVLDGQLFDAADLVRQLVDSSLPISLLCADDCSGLCPTCGNRRDAGCTCPVLIER